MMEDRANILREMKVCRFCLSSEERELSNIYDRHPSDSKQSVPIPLQIMACVSIEVFSNDGMPQLICSSCRKLTAQAYLFKSNCKKADDALKVFLATGQLTKPYLQKIDEVRNTANQPSQARAPPKPQTQIKVLQKAPSSNNAQQIPSKRIKMEDGTEIITLNFAASGEQADSSNDPLEQPLDDATSGYEEEVRDEEEGARATDEDYMSSLEDEQHINPVFKVNQVTTDCFPCPHCERSFPLKQLLDLHLPIHSRERNYKCDECNRKFFSKNDLQKHYQTHTGQKPHNCVVCQKSFSRYSLLRRHEKIHNDVPKYVCTQCDKTFLTKHYLDTHVEKHKKKRPYTCNVCNKSFVFKQGLERHEIVHSDNKPHKCNYCEVSFTSAIKLTRHLTSHAGLRPYPCKMCGRTFLLSHHLTRHMRSHYAAHTSTPEAIFGQHKCDICSMSFRRKDSLINHSAIHSMVNLRCVICNTAFDSAKMVKEHITTHLTGLPFPCEKCDYSFETSEQLEEHELKHAEMEYEEQIEQEVFSEARLQQEQAEEEPEESEITEYTISNVVGEDVNVVPKHPPARIADFLKDELSSDAEDTPAAAETPQEDQPQEPPEESIEPIKPIVRQEGTRVYQRKAPISRKLPTIVQNPKNVAPLEHLTQLEQLTPETINTMPTKNAVDMKLGDKVVRVKKFIVTKEEMKAMAKQGILEMKGGQVVLKSPGQPILNATLKPVQKVDIENLLDQKAQSRQQVKKYQRKSTPLAAAADENSKHNEEPPEVDMSEHGIQFP